MNWNLWLFAIAVISTVRQFWPSGRTRLSYIVNSHKPLVTVRDEIVGNIEVRYQGRRVSALHLIELAIINTGDRALKPVDFERPLSIRLAHTSQLFDVSRDDAYDGSVGAKFSFSEQRLRIEPVLLNPGESIALRLLVNELARPWRLHVRIVGVTRINEILNHPRVYERYRRFWQRLLVACGLVLAGDLVAHVLHVRNIAALDAFAAMAAVGVVVSSLLLPAMHAESTLLRPLHRPADSPTRYGLLESVRIGDDEQQALPDKVLAIHRAVYGAGDSVIDVTQRLKERMLHGRLDVVASNDLAGTDPAPNQVKQLRIEYTVGSEAVTRVVPEGSRVELP